MSNETNTEPNKPIEAQELTEKELEGVAGGRLRDLKILDKFVVA